MIANASGIRNIFSDSSLNHREPQKEEGHPYRPYFKLSSWYLAMYISCQRYN